MELRSGPEGFVVCWLRRTVLGKHSQWIHSTKEPGALRSVGLVLVERNHWDSQRALVGYLDELGKLILCTTCLLISYTASSTTCRLVNSGLLVLKTELNYLHVYI